MRLWVLFLICVSVWPCWAEAESSRAGTVDELNKALTNLGSFRADYHGTGREQTVDITVMVHRQHQYCLVTASGTDANLPDLAIIVDSSQMDAERATMKWLLIVDGKASETTVSLRDMAQKLDNPVGLFLFMARQFGSVAGVDAAKEIKFRPGHPVIALGLGKETLNCSVGISSEGHGVGVSWLDPNVVDQATDVSVSPGAFTFLYPENHTVAVDRKTGLLLKDSWPDSTGTTRQIELKSHSPLPRNLTYRKAIPALDGMTVEESPMPQLSYQLYVSFLADLGRQLAQIDDLDNLLKRNASALGQVMMQAGARMVRDDKTVAGSDEDIRTFRDEFIPAARDKILEQNPHLSGTASPEEFLDSLIESAKNKRLKLMPPRSQEFVNRIHREPAAILSQLPPDARDPLAKLYQVATPPFVGGGISELLLVKLERAKALSAGETAGKK